MPKKDTEPPEEAPVIALDEEDVAILKSYGKGPFGDRVEKVEKSINSILKEIKTICGVRETDTGLAPPSQWDLQHDQMALNMERALQVARLTKILPEDEDEPWKACIELKQSARFVVGKDKELAPTDLEDDMRVGVDRGRYEIKLPLPPRVDPSVSVMQVEEKPDVTYQDVGGCAQQLKQLREVVELPMLRPERFTKLGIDPPKGVLLYGPPGTGKCLGRDTPVLMHSGEFKMVQDIVAGDLLMGDDNTARTVLSTTTGREEMARVTFSTSSPLTTNMSHVLSLLHASPTQVRVQPDGTAVAEWCEAGDRNPDGSVSTISPHTLVSTDAEEAKAHLAALGAAGRRITRTTVVDISVRDLLDTAKVPADILQQLKAFHPAAMEFGGRHPKPEVDPYQLGLSLAEGAQHIPDALKYGTRETRGRLLAGLIDAGSFQLTLASQTLLEDVAFVARSLGLLAIRSGPGLTIRGDCEHLPLRVATRPSPSEHLEDVSVEVLPVDDYFGFTLDGNSRFVVNEDMLVTHNTLSARAVANRTQSTFIRVIGSELVQKYVGEGARMVRELFQMARTKKSCIIFFDEVDAFGLKRSQSAGETGDSGVQRTMLELINQLDGFSGRGNIKVIMATNRPDILDPALLRPGRLDRKVEFGLPDLAGRAHIFRILTRSMSVEKNIRYKLLARLCPSSTGADLRSVCTEAGMFAIRARRKVVVEQDFLDAIEKVIKGFKKFSATAKYMSFHI
eukprot:gnl/Dysnectes_brevis/2030_a2342_1081.p1 GENE.gnl/Dysnectes_brevis/2030_a2342_1081~~gnl/Dysnectes_brevis/2030_a2342_1081.p1  ORF type:complete len:735 (-),score=286.85 gnl/Dysnectes_brevis/2030_a2342_1081:123-2327(-)